MTPSRFQALTTDTNSNNQAWYNAMNSLLSESFKEELRLECVDIVAKREHLRYTPKKPQNSPKTRKKPLDTPSA